MSSSTKQARPAIPVLFPARATGPARPPDPERVANAGRILEALRAALEDEEHREQVGGAVLAIEAAQRAWNAPTFDWTVRSIVRVLDFTENPREARAWLAAVDNRFAGTPIVRMAAAIEDWRQAMAERRPGRPSKGGPRRTAGRIVWDLLRWAEVTTGTEESTDREVRRALQGRRRGRNPG
jgi:hypothetical protein